MPDYFVIRTHHNCEQRATRSLETLGCRVYQPDIRVLKRERGNVRQFDAPLFPSFLFVRDDRRGIDHITTAYGVSEVVRDGDEPVRLPHDVLDRLRSREDEQGYVMLFPAPLARLMIKDEFDTLLVAMRGAARSLLLLMWLVGKQPAWLECAA